MKKKAALLTLNGNSNYGNKLQHYGLQYYLKNIGVEAETIKVTKNGKLKANIKIMIKKVIDKTFRDRYNNFIKFDNKIKYSRYKTNNDIFDKRNCYEYYIIGSDQVWNVNFKAFSKCYLLDGISNINKISYASSFGISKLPEEYSKLFKDNLNDFKSISVREDKGKEIIEKLTNREDIEVLIDPTMLLEAHEWEKVEKRPKQLNNINNNKYILNYFLGNFSKKRKEEIERIAKENKCYIINILDKNDPFYTCGPSEFLYLEKNAFLICTDSFHSSVFAILYNKPFIIFDREESGVESMSSRLDTLLKKFELKNRKFNGERITNENLNHDYSEAYKILEVEREKSKKFLEKALDIEDNK